MKSTFYLLTYFLFFSSLTAIYGQQCGFDEKRQELLQNPEYLELERAAERKIKEALESPEIFNRTGASNVLTIPIVIHVLHLGEAVGTGSNISDAQIQSSIDNLNDYYRGQIPTSPIDFEIEFVLAQRDPNCNATTGINRIDASAVANYSANGVSLFGGAGSDEDTLKDLSRWPETDYFNVWIVTEINGNNGGSGFQGYANFYYGSIREGSVMMYTVFGYDPTNANPSWNLNFARDNSTVVHEAGHYFHLYHTFEGDNGGADCPADTIVDPFNGNSDGCADTVPHRRETSTCPANNSCTGNPWIDNNTINNIMSYYSCSDRLTNDQKTRSRAAMEGTSIVAESKGAIPIDLTYAAPSTACNTNSSPSNFSGITDVELNGINYSSNSAGFDGGNIDLTADCETYFEIDTEVANTLNTAVVSVNEQQLGVWIDWNDDGDFDDDSELQYFQDDINDTASNVAAIPLIYPSSIPYGDYVRIRLITDIDDRYSGVGLINSGCYSSIVYGQSEDYTIYIKPAPITYMYNGSWSPANPAGVCTGRDDILIQSGYTNITADTDCKTLTVSPGAAVTVDSGSILCAETVNLNSTSLTFSSLIVNGTVTATINYNRYTAILNTNDLISAPLSGEAFGAFATANSNLAASGTVRAFGPYNTTAGAYQNFDTGANMSTVIDSGIGYRAATTDGSALTFTGTALTGNVEDIAITDASAGFAWNLIGNPYPSYLDFDAFFQQNKNEFDSASTFQAIYGYDGDASNGWTIWNQASITEGSITELIAPGQGFFVKAKSGGGSVDFTTAMRIEGSSGDFVANRNPIINVALCKLNINSNSNDAYTQIYFIENTTRGLDVGYDAGNYQGSAGEFSIFSNLVENNTGIDMAIQTLPYNDLNDVVIPLGINADSATQLTVSIDEISSLPENINIYLEDNIENTFTLLNNNDYVFTPSTDLIGTGRFYIHFTSQVLSVADNDLENVLIYATSNPKKILVNGRLSEDTKASLYDIQGRLVLSKILDASRINNSIDVSNVVTGIYIVALSNDQQTITQKVIIK